MQRRLTRRDRTQVGEGPQNGRTAIRQRTADPAIGDTPRSDDLCASGGLRCSPIAGTIARPLHQHRGRSIGGAQGDLLHLESSRPELGLDWRAPRPPPAARGHRSCCESITTLRASRWPLRTLVPIDNPPDAGSAHSVTAQLSRQATALSIRRFRRRTRDISTR